MPGRLPPRPSFPRRCAARPRPLHDDPGAVDVGDDALRVDLDTQVARGPAPPSPERRSPNLASTSLPPSKSRIRAVLRVDLPEVVLEHSSRQLGDLPGDLDPGRAAADDDEGEPPPPLLRVALELGHLEGPEDPAPQLERVVDRLHSGRPARELVVAEVGLPGAGGDDQAVVGKLEEDPVGAHGGHASAPPGRSR